MNPIDNKTLAFKYFELKEGLKHVCKLCNPEWTPDSTTNVKTYTKTKGYSWAIQHLKKHDGYETHVPSSQTLLISSNADNTYKWIEWIVTENRDLDFLEKKFVQKYTKQSLQSISTETLKKKNACYSRSNATSLSKTFTKKIWPGI
jgi:hypothetical protein